jgi:hypothetical protein
LNVPTSHYTRLTSSFVPHPPVPIEVGAGVPKLSGAQQLAARIGDGDEFVEHRRLAARLHDVGKLSMLDAILRKRGRLTADERRVMKTHTTNGAAILAGSAFPVLSLGEQIRARPPRALGRQRLSVPPQPRGVPPRRPDRGRRRRLRRTHLRAFKPAWPLPEAVTEIVNGSGTQFDPRVVRAFRISTASAPSTSPSPTYHSPARIQVASRRV